MSMPSDGTKVDDICRYVMVIHYHIGIGTVKDLQCCLEMKENVIQNM